MALAAKVVYTVIDDSGERGTTEINVPTGFSLAQYTEFGAAMATFLDAILGGKVESADICFGVDLSGLTSNTALSTSDVEEIGAFVFQTSEGLNVICNVPCIDELTVISGSDDLDQAHVDIAALITAFEDGLVTAGGTIEPTDVAEVDIVTTISARERFRASGTRA
jgi:hypothetical protein